MISSVLVALSAFIVSATARVEIESTSTAFFNAGMQGCISVPENANGAPVTIHDCNTQKNASNQDWELSFFTRQPAGPQPIKVFGDKCIRWCQRRRDKAADLVVR